MIPMTPTPRGPFATPAATETVDARTWITADIAMAPPTAFAIRDGVCILTLNGRVGATAITAEQIVGAIPAEYRPVTEVYGMGQAIGGGGAKAFPNGNIVFPAINAGAYLKVTLSWIH